MDNNNMDTKLHIVEIYIKMDSEHVFGTSTDKIFKQFFFSRTYCASWYYQNLYSPTDAKVNCSKNNFKIYIEMYINP